MKQMILIIIATHSVLALAESKSGQAGVRTAVTSNEEAGELPGKMYGSIELRHHLNTYYDSEDKEARQTPAFHGRAKIGATFRDNLIDAFATLGVIKGTSTQQVVQRRPEVEVDIYPVLGTYGHIVQYNMFQLPFEETAIEQEESETNELSSDGTIYTVGIAPTGILPWHINGSEIKFRIGMDAWTQFFSKPQYREDDRTADEGDRYGVADEAKEDDTGTFSGEQREDVAQRYYTQYMLGSSISPAWWRAMTFAVSTHYDVRYLPKYDNLESDDYKYQRKNFSHYRIRLDIALSERASLTNDFYHFHEGLFESKRRENGRRFRNLAKITYKL